VSVASPRDGVELTTSRDSIAKSATTAQPSTTAKPAATTNPALSSLPRTALVVGTGVSGLACALRLAEAGFAVASWEKHDVALEVSSVAAAIWYPYKAGPKERVEQWALETLAELERLAEDPATGVRSVRGIEWFPDGVEPRDCLRRVPEYRELGPSELRHDRARGITLRVPVVDMGMFLPWLRARCIERGVQFVRREIRSLDEAVEACALVVNCTGLASRELAHDDDLVAIRGQVLRVAGHFAHDFVIDENCSDGLCYVVPRGPDVVIGGSAVEGREDLAPDARETARILERARRHLPEISIHDVLETKVGLRPGRATVRLEAEVPRAGRLVIHDYGHGGAGVTLAFGCADEVVRIATAARQASEPAGSARP